MYAYAGSRYSTRTNLVARYLPNRALSGCGDREPLQVNNCRIDTGHDLTKPDIGVFTGYQTDGAGERVPWGGYGLSYIAVASNAGNGYCKE